MNIIINLAFDILYKIIILCLYIFRIYNFNLAVKKFKISRLIIEKELIKKSKSFVFFGKYLFWEKDLKNLKKKLKRNYIHSIKVDDLKFKLTFLNYDMNDAINQRIEGVREPSTVSAIRSLVKKNNNILELGSCYGYFTNIMAHCTGKNGKVVGIEGLPNNYNILKKNIELNNLKNVSIYNYFLSNRNVESKIYFKKLVDNPYDGMNEFIKGKNDKLKKGEYISVKVIRLSNFLKKIKFRPDHIFMDIEGFEVDVIEDLVKNYISTKNKPTILFEIHNPRYKAKKNLTYLKLLLSKRYNYIEDNGNLICRPKN